MAFDTAALIARANRLRVFQSDELAKKTHENEQAIVRSHAARGLLHSGNLISSLATLHKKNLPSAVEKAWELLKETHQAMGRDTSPETRQAMTSWMMDAIHLVARRASAQIAQGIAQYGGGLQNRLMLAVDETEQMENSLRSRYEAVIDNHLDQIMNNPTPEQT